MDQCDELILARDRRSVKVVVSRRTQARDRRSVKVAVSRRTQHSYSKSKGTRDHITVNACASASGVILPSYIIFPQAYSSGPYTRDGPDGALLFYFRN